MASKNHIGTIIQHGISVGQRIQMVSETPWIRKCKVQCNPWSTWISYYLKIRSLSIFPPIWSIIVARSPPSAIDTPKVSGIFTSLLVVYIMPFFCIFMSVLITLLFHRLLFMCRRHCSWPIRD
ncbi:MAG: hypothetical protein J3Q66DRAFT_351629, partial [Benniella sp.]